MRAALLALTLSGAVSVSAVAQPSNGEAAQQSLGTVVDDALQGSAEPQVGTAHSAPPFPGDDPLEAIAEEHVTDAMPFEAHRIALVERGEIWPQCTEMAYPDLTMQVERQRHTPSPEQAIQVGIAVDRAYLRQNLVRLGVDRQEADRLTEIYAAERRHDALSEEERVAEFDRKESPEHRLAAELKRDQRLFAGIQPVAEPEVCLEKSLLLELLTIVGGITPMLVVPKTWYRLVPSPDAASVHLISMFLFGSCATKGIDPHDLQQCPDWYEVTGQQMRLNGNYAVLVHWDDGRISCSRRAFPYTSGSEIHKVTFRRGAAQQERCPTPGSGRQLNRSAPPP